MKKLAPISILLIVIISIVFVIEYKNLTIKDVSSQTVVSESVEINTLPSEKDLLKYEGKDIQLLGTYQISTVNFNTQNVLLTNSDGKTLTFPITITDKEKNLFCIPEILYSPSDLKIADTIGLAEKNKQYFAYHSTE
ncbi:hypothetical protein V2123_000367 [Enterococcus faecium]